MDDAVSGRLRWEAGEELEEITLGPVTRLDLIKYAGASGDYNPIHTVDEAAYEAGLSGVIAHGMLTAATLGRLFSAYLERGYVKDLATRFTGMVHVGDALRVGGVATGRREAAGGVVHDFEVYARTDSETVVTGTAGFMEPTELVESAEPVDFTERSTGNYGSQEQERPEESREQEEAEALKREAAENGLDPEELGEEKLTKLARYFDEAISFSRHIGSKVEKVEPGKAVLHIDVRDHHLNGNGTLHGGVYASLIDNAMGICVLSKVGLRAATVQMDTRFLGPVNGGRITCHAEVLHQTRRMATARGSVYDEAGNLVAMGTGTFRVFENEGVTSV